MGKPKIIDAQYVKEGAYVIDVGVNSVDGHLCGDVDFESVAPKAGAITPVPKGCWSYDHLYVIAKYNHCI